MINFTDILKGKFLEEFAAISINEMVVAIALSLVLSLFIVLVYRLTYTGVSFSLSFAGCLVMISMVTATVILVITSNIVLSLGMVGALSIVRFRTAVKEASDTAFLFWAIATGIICGAGYVTIAILATVLIGLLFVAVSFLGRGYRAGSFMVVARYEAASGAEEKLTAMRGCRLKNKTVSGSFTELVVELPLGKKGMEELEALRNVAGVHEISIMRSVSGSVL